MSATSSSSPASSATNVDGRGSQGPGSDPGQLMIPASLYFVSLAVAVGLVIAVSSLMFTRQWVVRARERRLQALGIIGPLPYTTSWGRIRPDDQSPPQLHDLWTRQSTSGKQRAWNDIIPLSVTPIKLQPPPTDDAPPRTLPPTLTDRIFRLPPVPVPPPAPDAQQTAAMDPPTPMPVGPVRVSVLVALPQRPRTQADGVGDILLATTDTIIAPDASSSSRHDMNV
ncbi:hypothetical protein EXIGLDRAFT_828775 [Exidia glandulosa HHB12029]|uniref:Uncharacterized protein n=1 Tax=Exidia glandulosa HHB12029 TaxID=1314781 RepID=A0A165Q2Q3_EXIGL|nr:hypothetical protein EXIGLDRAFT_828775 [Exidia glandulosa HHB12029]